MNAITIIALIIFGLCYACILAFQKFRPYVALIAAAVFVALGSFPSLTGLDYGILDALRAVDWNVLMMIFGTMGVVGLFIKSKAPEILADYVVSKTKSARLAIVALAILAGFVSAFVDNVATVLMFAPVAFSLCEILSVSPVPVIISICISSNLQGAATLVGDTTSILLSKAAGLDFADFFFDSGKPGMFWVVEAGAIVSAAVLFFAFRKERSPVAVTKSKKIEDGFPAVLLVSMLVTLVAVSFIPYKDASAGGIYKPEITNGIVCMLFFAVGLIRQALKSRRNFKCVVAQTKISIDFYTLFLLAGLFAVIGGVEKAGVINELGKVFAKLGGGSGSVFLIYSAIVWGSVLFSAFIDNIPYTATMLPVVASLAANLAPASGGLVDPKLFYYGLLCGATLGGNLSPVGASANITGIGMLRKRGYTVSGLTFMKYSVPFTLAAVGVGYGLIWLFWS